MYNKRKIRSTLPIMYNKRKIRSTLPFIIMWTIYGNQYDLEKFMDKHPGGKAILLSTKNVGDIRMDVTVL